jgi:queuine tRNA-ribosyltransferase-like protein
LFRVLSRDPSSSARSGELETRHGVIETPCFMPVGTRGAVKGVAFDWLEAWGCRVVLANTYHLMARPGVETIAAAGGLHAFIGWNGAILTDSGGFQVMSLSSRRKVTDEGVEFRAPEDGTRHFLTPERAMELQSAFGVDVAMALDVCPSLPAQRAELEEAVRITIAWAERCRRAWSGPGLLFGIVQGGTDEALRRRCAEAVVEMGFPGYAIGGVAVGEEKAAIRDVTDSAAALLPLPHGRRHARRPPRVGALRGRPLRLRAAHAQRANGTRVHARGRGDDQARAIQGRPRAARSVLRVSRVPTPLARIPEESVRAQGLLGADADLDAQRLLLPGVDAADPRGDHGGGASWTGGASRGEDPVTRRNP